MTKEIIGVWSLENKVFLNPERVAKDVDETVDKVVDKEANIADAS